MLSLLAVVCLLLGSSAGLQSVQECYGGTLKFPFIYTPPLFRGQLYFTPRGGGTRKILMDDGKVQDPRVKSSLGMAVVLNDLREADDGVFSASEDGKPDKNIISLRILECADDIVTFYGQRYILSVPSQSEYLEFSPLRTKNQTKILWSRRTGTSDGGRGNMRPGGWTFFSVTQTDNGYYNFRKKDNTLLSRKKLSVLDNNEYYDANVNGRLFIKTPSEGAPWTVTFNPEGEETNQMLIQAGSVVAEDDWISAPFSGRIRVLYDGVEIEPVEFTDSGSFEFRDQQGNLAQVVTVQVHPEDTPTYVYAAIAGGIALAVIVCCCCMRKCCCKKSSTKRDASAQAAVYRNDANQAGGPMYYAAPAPVHSYQPVNPPASRQPAATSAGPSVYKPLNIHVNPLQPEVVSRGGQGAAPAPSLGSDCLSSDPDPKFELKGSTCPLSSDSTSSYVYTSDKLNFI